MNETDVDSLNDTGFANNFKSTLTNDITFTDVITNSYFYGSSIIFIILILCIITFIFILKNKSKLLFSTNL